MTNGMRGTEVAHHFSILDNEISESAELLNEQKYSRIIHLFLCDYAGKISCYGA